MKKAAATKKPTSAKANGTDRPVSAKTTSATTKATSAAKPTAPKVAASKPSDSTKTTKTSTKAEAPVTPKTPKPPVTPKTPKPPAVPTTPKTKPAAASRPATAKPTSTTASKPAAAAAKRPATATATATTTTKPAATKAGPSTSRPATATAKPTTTKAGPSTARPATATTAKTTTKAGPSTSRPATATTAKTTTTTTTKPGPASARPGTSSVSPREPAAASSAPARPSVPGLAKPAPSSAPANGKKATTPRGTTTGPPLKSPRSAEGALKSPRKSPRHNVASLSRTSTAPELIPHDVVRPHLTAGSRSVSVGGLQSNITRAAPVGRRKPTVNPVKSRKDTPIREQTAPPPKAAASFYGGMGILASVGGEGQEFGQMQLRKVSEDKPKPLLIRVKGRRNVTARAVETTCKSLNRGDAFVLIDPSTRTVYEWRGSSANKMEVAKAMDIAGRVKNKEFGGRADIFVLEDGKTDTNTKFWELLGGKGAIAPPESVGEDEDEDKVVRQDYLFGIVEKTPGKPELQQIAKSKFNKEMMQSGQVYLLDCLTELYMWVGKGCANPHRSFIAAKAQEALTGVKVRPKWVGITRVIEGAEPEIFKEKFCDWPSTLPITMAAIAKGNVALRSSAKFDVATMFLNTKREDRNIDDGAGKTEIWRVKDHAKEAVDPSMYGQFFDTESYVILYKYMIKNREVFIIYFWQGKKSSIQEKGSSALLTVDLDDSIGGSATQIRVVQNKEPKHFMKLFKGYIIVHKSEVTEDGASAVPETALYQIRGCNNVDGVGCDTRAVQLFSPDVKYLNTNDIFLLNTPEKQFIWLGSNSCKFLVISQEVLVQLGNTIKGSREQVFIREGEEPSEFWEYMGEGDYYKTAWKALPRLFHCSSASGAFRVEEVMEWDQEDLDPGHHHILDTSGDVFLWTGHRAIINLEEEKKMSLQTALDYARLHPVRSGAGSSDNILSVYSLKEPYAFRSLFLGWDDSKAKSNGENDVVRVEDLLKDLSRNYTLAELRNAPKMLDSSRLESYLSTEEFMSVFKIDKEAFAAQPLWKREQQKKNVGLY